VATRLTAVYAAVTGHTLAEDQTREAVA